MGVGGEGRRERVRRYEGTEEVWRYGEVQCCFSGIDVVNDSTVCNKDFPVNERDTRRQDME